MAKSVFTDEYRLLLKHIVEARKEAHLTQGELAAKLGCNQSFISKYERGVRRLDVVEFIGIARALGINAAELVKEIEAIAPTVPSRRRNENCSR